MTLYLSRLSLSKAPQTAALNAILNPEDPARRMDAHHRLLWAAFTDGPDRRRDFLWREEAPGAFMTLSARPPEPSNLFAPPETRDFAPQLAEGDRLAFALRANATRDRKGKGRVDVVMDALHGLPQAERAARRMELAQTEGRAWMDRQGAKSGFSILSLQVGDYSVAALPGHRGPRKDQPQFGILDMTGMLTVTDPAAFVAALSQGFGRAKSYGCGLMLIRRA
ncbi:type I-E CRISPR-associated protein Cas6/Cse3/CasE [Rhodobacter sp. KR11]|uniref:type I-E CRISPR-associated protein Cas6/Cse3/CasE n=1 Tax=Rhodobacter sp. KR11 TaxID=2974588 RepID=UPI002221C242|nr:type I-E CRISPR-associated protein Cas6/Cse3/CasE [Rhodobacter sp. KR11]MCW1918125.1 type I-E CRISPR-associated protein Cas6/Cse3/CasE [Rhodobacter sp. KR11]